MTISKINTKPKKNFSLNLNWYYGGMTRGWLPQRTGLPLNDSRDAAAVPPPHPTTDAVLKTNTGMTMTCMTTAE